MADLDAAIFDNALATLVQKSMRACNLAVSRCGFECACYDDEAEGCQGGL